MTNSDAGKPTTDIVQWLMKASKAIYLATEGSVADDISPKLKQAAHEINMLREANNLLNAAISEAEAILGGEYADFHGPLYDMIQEARAALSPSSNEQEDRR